MKDFILLLGANQYLRERSLAGARMAFGGKIFIANKNAIFEKNRFFDDVFICDEQDYEKLIELIEAKQKEGFKFLSAVPLNDWSLESATRINSHFHLPCLSFETIANSRDKSKMKECFMKANLTVAKSFLLSCESELEEAIPKLSLPVVIKPYDFGGSGGVYLAYTKDEAKQKLRLSKQLIEKYKDKFKIKGNKFLIEEFIDSMDEVSVEVLCLKNSYISLSITEKYLSDKPYFSEMAHLVPSHRNDDKNLHDLAHRACKALGIDLGVAHVELKIKDNKAYVIEVGARTGGDGIMDQVENAFDVNPYFLHISSYLGKDLSSFTMPKAKQSCAIAFLKAKSGRIKKINKLERLPKELSSIKITAKEGDLSTEAKDWSAREGVLEFVFKEKFKEKTFLPLSLSKKLSDELFEVE